MKKEGELTMTCEGGAKDYRLDIRYPDGSYHGGMSCGTVIEVLTCGTTGKVLCEDFRYTDAPEWKATTIESGYSSEGEEAWYLTGLYKPGEIPYGLTVRK